MFVFNMINFINTGTDFFGQIVTFKTTFSLKKMAKNVIYIVTNVFLIFFQCIQILPKYYTVEFFLPFLNRKA